MDAEREKLVTENLRLAGYMMKHYGDSGIEPEELQSLCYLGIVEAASRFDKSRGTRFSTLACRCMQNNIHGLMRDRKAQKRDFVTVSLAKVISSDETRLTLEDLLFCEDMDLKKIEDSELIRSIKNSGDLTEKERKAVLLWLAGERQDAIGKEIGLSQSYTGRLIRKCARKLYAGNYL